MRDQWTARAVRCSGFAASFDVMVSPPTEAVSDDEGVLPSAGGTAAVSVAPAVAASDGDGDAAWPAVDAAWPDVDVASLVADAAPSLLTPPPSRATIKVGRDYIMLCLRYSADVANS